MPTYELELLTELSDQIAEGLIKKVDEQPIVDSLEENFLFVGSKIDWTTTKDHKAGLWQGQSKDCDFLEFFGERVKDFGAQTHIYYVNDNQLNYALKGSMRVFQKNLPTIFQIPAHHYFIDEDFGWCLVYSMEGNLDFGCRNK